MFGLGERARSVTGTGARGQAVTLRLTANAFGESTPKTCGSLAAPFTEVPPQDGRRILALINFQPTGRQIACGALRSTTYGSSDCLGLLRPRRRQPSCTGMGLRGASFLSTRASTCGVSGEAAR